MSDSQNIDEILAQIEKTLKLPMGIHMPCVLIHGKDDSLNTSIIARFKASSRKVVRMKTSRVSSVGQFFNSFLDRIKVTYNPLDNFERKMDCLHKSYHPGKVDILLLDEFDRLIAKCGHQLLDLILGLSDELGISIVATSSGAARKVIMSNMQAGRRFQQIELT
jgi:hypothetical protein